MIICFIKYEVNLFLVKEVKNKISINLKITEYEKGIIVPTSITYSWCHKEFDELSNLWKGKKNRRKQLTVLAWQQESHTKSTSFWGVFFRLEKTEIPLAKSLNFDTIRQVFNLYLGDHELAFLVKYKDYLTRILSKKIFLQLLRLESQSLLSRSL